MMKIGHTVDYDVEKYEVVWIYNNEIIEIKLVRKNRSFPKIIPIHISKLDKLGKKDR